jgi:prophage antirepressor-like protein
MDILKAFKIDINEFPVNIQGTHDDPLFQANQIAKILDIRNIRDAIKNFNEDEKVITNSYTLGGEQECLFFNFIHVVLNYTNNSIIYLFIYLY